MYVWEGMLAHRGVGTHSVTSRGSPLIRRQFLGEVPEVDAGYGCALWIPGVHSAIILRDG